MAIIAERLICFFPSFAFAFPPAASRIGPAGECTGSGAVSETPGRGSIWHFVITGGLVFVSIQNRVVPPTGNGESCAMTMIPESRVGPLP
jgi:hypothetical protein